MFFKRWQDRYPLRYEAEQIIMAENHPQFVLKLSGNNNLFWEGILQTNFDNLYRVTISYPISYPWQKPILKVVEPKLRMDAPHRFADGSLCIYPADWTYKRTTAPAAIPLIASWLTLYEIFLKTGKRW